MLQEGLNYPPLKQCGLREVREECCSYAGIVATHRRIERTAQGNADRITA